MGFWRDIRRAVFNTVGMSKSKRRELSPAEQHVLEHGHLQLLTSREDMNRCNEAILKHHYLHDATLVGGHVR